MIKKSIRDAKEKDSFVSFRDLVLVRFGGCQVKTGYFDTTLGFEFQ
jgi:hypothetical protein